MGLTFKMGEKRDLQGSQDVFLLAFLLGCKGNFHKI